MQNDTTAGVVADSAGQRLAGGEPMAREPLHGSLDERKLALEERKLDSEIEFRRLEYGAKTKESGWLARLFTPLTTTIL
jgi:hypothetical protein